MPPIKEIHYFDRSPSYPSPNILAETKLLYRLRRPGYSKNALKAVLRRLFSKNHPEADWWSHYYLHDYSDSWYLKLFSSRDGITGDITPSYSILSQADVARMKRLAPKTKLVFLIRNPIDRAWSHFRFIFGHSLNLDDFEAFRSFVDSPRQELRSNYLRTLDLYLSCFDPSQILIGFYDAIKDQPKELLSEILRHIGAAGLSGQETLQQVYNKSKECVIPERHRKYLENKYNHDLEELARRYGGYASRWLFCRQQHTGQMNEANNLSPVAHP